MNGPHDPHDPNRQPGLAHAPAADGPGQPAAPQAPVSVPQPAPMAAPPAASAPALPPGYQMHPQQPGYIWNPSTNDVRPLAPPVAAPAPHQQPIVVNVSNSNQNVANASVQATAPAATKSAALAAVLSFLFVGAGQLYNGQVGKALLMFVGTVLAWLILLGWIVQIWAIVDAYTTANRINRGAA